MATKNIDTELADIRQKLDFVVAQMQEQEKQRREMRELKEDLSLIGKDVLQSAIVELQDVSPYFDTDDLIHLVKKLLRNVQNLNRMMDQIESLMDFFEDLKPIQKKAFSNLLEKLDEMDRKGFFAFFREAYQILDTVVTDFTVEDVKLLRENITSILLTVKGMTQPDMLGAMNNAVGFYKRMDIEVSKDVTLGNIFRELKDPEVKRGMIFMLEFIKSMVKKRPDTMPETNNGPVS